MRILHIMFTGRFTEGMSYQENLLPKFHAKDGHKVTMLTTCYECDNTGETCYAPPIDKIMSNGVRLIRMNYHKIINNFITNKIRKVDGVYQLIKRLLPDIIFFHGPQSVELLTVVKFIKNNPEIRLFIDSHADFSNSASNFLSLYILHKIFYKYIAKKAERYTSMFYGVLPARVDFLINIYKIPKTKCKLLVMGADDEEVINVRNNNVREQIRRRFRFSADDFVIITGGKIDSAKAQTLFLLQALQSLNISKIKLLIFGSIASELKEKLLSYVDNNKIFYIGWIKSEEVYGYYAASDLAVFPGRHSVFWEQAVGTGIPCFFKYWKGATHVDVGGNCKFLYTDQMEEIKIALEDLINNPDSYLYMKKIAEERGIKKFSYKEISRKAIQF